MNNKKRGANFEKQMAEWLSRQGYWVHFCNPAPDGSQPCDLIAAAGASTDDELAMFAAFDCKTLEGENHNLDGLRFPLSRIEDNQETSFERMNFAGLHNTYFVIKLNKTQAVIAPSQLLIQKKKQGQKSIHLRELVQYGIISLQ